MSQPLAVSFHPTEYRYYYDCIRVKSQDQSYVVPLHGYPLLNKIEIPRVIKFADAPLCGTVHRVRPVPVYATNCAETNTSNDCRK